MPPKNVTCGVVVEVKKRHRLSHGAGENLTRHEKMPQIHRFGEFRLHSVGHFGHVDGALLCPESTKQRLFSIY
jgi:hypothetical protein